MYEEGIRRCNQREVEVCAQSSRYDVAIEKFINNDVVVLFSRIYFYYDCKAYITGIDKTFELFNIENGVLDFSFT